MKSHKRSIHTSPKHTWRDKDRLTLALLDICYSNPLKQYALIFNRMKKYKLSEEGFLQGMPTTSMSSQLHEMKNGGTGSDLWDTICDLSPTQLRAKFRDDIHDIEVIARKVGIILEPITTSTRRSETQIRPSLSLRRRARELTINTETSITTWNPDLEDEDDCENAYTPTRAGKKSLQQSGSLSRNMKSAYLFDRVSPRYDGTSSKTQTHPYFLYRAFEVSHGLRARRFLESNEAIPAPPSFKSRAFEAESRSHLDRNKTYISPFLSFAQNPAVAIKHAFNKIAEGVPMALAIVRYDDVKQEMIDHFGIDAGPYLTPNICRQHDLWDLPGAYTGTGEFLVWGSVNSKPVAIVQGSAALMYRAILRTTIAIDAYAGMRLNKHLPKSLDPQHLELFLYQLITGYKVKGHKSARKSKKYTEFVAAATPTVEAATPTIEANLDVQDDQEFD